MMNRLIAAAVGALLLVAGVACEDEQTKNRDGQAQPLGNEPQAQLGRAAPEEQSHKMVKVEIQDRSINPRQLELQADQPIQLEVTNSTSMPCTFYIESFLVALQVPGNETAKQSLTLPRGGSGSGTGSESVDMGCQGDSQRQGRAVVEFRGTAPVGGR